MPQHRPRVIAVRTGVQEVVQFHDGERAVRRRPEGHRDFRRVPGGREGELLLSGEFDARGPAGRQHRREQDVLDDQLLLGAETPTHPGGLDPEPIGR